ncbi:hypothetical protein DPEC_G00359270 [Dallia pectoralis]|uniref:Uncharacterized protein n=1 Tax=Dallia pectoralis TaxID=75939 RepID=A0ACC2F0J9_DALPE|nr:hypothetical protein DPEC_G00359270 [Dallia pectoralis]
MSACTVALSLNNPGVTMTSSLPLFHPVDRHSSLRVGSVPLKSPPRRLDLNFGLGAPWVSLLARISASLDEGSLLSGRAAGFQAPQAPCPVGGDGGSEDLADLRSPSLDHHYQLRHASKGGSVDSDGAFEGDFAAAPLSATEGMQHIRLMEGVSRSLPSSPLLAHQAASVRLQSTKKHPVRFYAAGSQRPVAAGEAPERARRHVAQHFPGSLINSAQCHSQRPLPVPSHRADSKGI